MCGCSLHNVLHYSTWVLYERYVTSCSSSIILTVSHLWVAMRPPPHLPPQGGSHKAEQVLVWSGSKTQTNKKDGGKKRREIFFSPLERVWKKKICRWTRDKARLLCCYGNSYMPISLFVEHCVVIFDKHTRTRTHAQLQITSIYQPHPCDTVTIAITLLEK